MITLHLYWFLWLKRSLLGDQADQIPTVKLLSLLARHESKTETAIKKTSKIVCKWLIDLKKLYRTVFFCILKCPSTAKHVLNFFPVFCKGRQETMVVNILLRAYIKGQHEPVHKEKSKLAIPASALGNFSEVTACFNYFDKLSTENVATIEVLHSN